MSDTPKFTYRHFMYGFCFVLWLGVMAFASADFYFMDWVFWLLFPLVIWLLIEKLFPLFYPPWLEMMHEEFGTRESPPYEPPTYPPPAVVPDPPLLTRYEFLERVLNQHGTLARAENIPTVDGELRDKLKKLVTDLFSYHSDRERDHDLIAVCVNILITFTRNQPTTPSLKLGVAPLYDLINTKKAVAHLVGVCFAPEANDILNNLQKQLNTNRYAISKRLLSKRDFEDGVRVSVEGFQGTGKQIVDTYLEETWLKDLFYVQFPVGLTEKTRFEHMHILAVPGHGKTQTLQLMIDRDLETDASILVIDPHSNMVERLLRRQTAKTVVYLDPEDLPSLNPFDIKFDRADTQALTDITSTYEYFFGSLLGSELTAKQTVLFRYLAQLMLRVPGATVQTMINLMDEPEQYLAYIHELPSNARNFLVNEFLRGSGFKETSSQVKARLYGVMALPAFEQMFNAAENRLNLGQALNSGAVVLVNARNDYLKEEGASIFGRFFIAQALQVAFGRARILDHERRPTFVYVDEAAMFFDRTLTDILNQARKFKLGLILAHQDLGKVTPELQSALQTTAIKLVGRVTDHDARVMASNMHCKSDELTRLSHDQNSAEWMLYDRNSHRSATQISIPFWHLENQPTRDSEAYTAFRKANRERLTAQSVEQKSEPQGQEW